MSEHIAALDRDSSNAPACGPVHVLGGSSLTRSAGPGFNGVIKHLEERGLRLVIHRGEDAGDGAATAGVSQAGRNTGIWRRWRVKLRGLDGARHLMSVWLSVSLSASAYTFVRETLRIPYALFTVLRSVILMAATLPATLINVPRDAKRLIVGRGTTPAQVSPLASALTRALPTGTAGAADPVVIFADRLDILNHLIELDFLAPGHRSPIFVVFAAWSSDTAPASDTVDRATLGRRWQTADVARRTRLYAMTPPNRAALADALSVDTATVDTLAADLAHGSAATAAGGGTKPIAVSLRPAWVVCGSSTVFCNQTEYLAERGYRVLEIGVQQHFTDLDRAHEVTEWFLSETKGSWAHKLLLLHLGVGLRPWLSVFARGWRKLLRSPLARRALKIELADLPPTWAEVLAAMPPDLVIVNHCWHMPLARKLFPRARLVLEAHDIQARQLKVHADVERGADAAINVGQALADELDMMRPADAIVSINSSESEFFASKPAMPPVTTVFPYLAMPVLSHGRDVVAGDADHTDHAEPPIDVLLVASNHPANAESLRWFMAEVYRPHLATAGLSVLAVGNIADALDEDEKIVPFAGRVADIMAYYDRARVVALPVVAGAGLPIKTMEALSLGMAVVATSSAVRGLPLADRPLTPVDDPRAFADELVRLLDDEALRDQRRAAARAFTERVFSKQAYFDNWDGVIATLGEKHLKASAPNTDHSVYNTQENLDPTH